jgi:dATP pyrophosphohydrolase
VAIRYGIECWIFSAERNVLLLQVPARRGEHEAFWQPITGGIEGNETPRQAAVREIHEETGLELDDTRLTEIATGLTVVITPQLTISKTLYTATTPSTMVIISAEHQDHRWLPTAQVLDALFWDSNRNTWEIVGRHHRDG